MHKKKISALVVATLLTVSVIGGTLAWFTSQDSVTNIFNTGTTDNKDNIDSGIKIEEDFDKDQAGNVLPGSEVNKDVQVSNTSSYDQFIRVKITPKFMKVNEKGEREEITSVTIGNEVYELDTDLIELKFKEHLKTDKSEGSWFKGNDGYYYYMGKVGVKSYTNTLLDSVTLSKDAGNEYKNIGFDVVVKAESIQASNDAYKDWSESSLHEIFATLQSGSATNPKDNKIVGNK